MLAIEMERKNLKLRTSPREKKVDKNDRCKEKKEIEESKITMSEASLIRK